MVSTKLISQQVKMAVQYMRRVIQKKAKFDIMDLNVIQVYSFIYAFLIQPFSEILSFVTSLAFVDVGI